MEKSELFENAKWRKSNGSSDGNCVEVAAASKLFGVRDSKAPTDGMLVFGNRDWRMMLAGVKAGEFDL